jgi:hypothetical protein
MFDNFASHIGADVIKVPLPPSLIRAFGCRPGTSILLHVVDGQIRALPEPEPTAKQATPQHGPGNIAELCGRWWKSQ